MAAKQTLLLRRFVVKLNLASMNSFPPIQVSEKQRTAKKQKQKQKQKTSALPQNLWVDSDWFSVAFQGWHNLEVFAHPESRARDFFRHPLLRPMIFCI